MWNFANCGGSDFKIFFFLHNVKAKWNKQLFSKSFQSKVKKNIEFKIFKKIMCVLFQN